MTGGDRGRGVEVPGGVEREEHQRADREPEDLIGIGAVEQLHEQRRAVARSRAPRNGGTVGSRRMPFWAAKATVRAFSPAATAGSSGATPAPGKFIRSSAPACTAPGPLAAPAMARSAGERFSPGMIVSANASNVGTIKRIAGEHLGVDRRRPKPKGRPCQARAAPPTSASKRRRESSSALTASPPASASPGRRPGRGARECRARPASRRGRRGHRVGCW